MSKEKDYGTFTINDQEYKYVRDPKRVMNSAAIGYAHHKHGGEGAVWAIAERIFNEEDFTELLDSTDMETFATELSQQALGVELEK